MTVQVQSGTGLDWNRLYRVFNALPVQPEGFDKRGDPLDARGKVMPQRESLKYFLQDGLLYDEAGHLLEKAPKHVLAIVDRMKAKHPFPGITHKGKVVQCPAPGCGFRTTVQEYYREHKHLHSEITGEQWRQLEGGVKPPPVFNLGDFADPTEVMEGFVGAAPPQRESPQGEG